MLDAEKAWEIFNTAEEIHSAHAVSAALERMAGEISAQLGNRYPLVLSVMGGAIVFSGKLLPMLAFPLDFDYVQVSRYGNATQGGQMVWKMHPSESVSGRVVLVLDDILDEGITLAEIHARVMAMGAAACYSAVFVDKELGRPKPIKADFVGLSVPNRYVFGFGMDVHGAWRNLPAIYALKEE